MRDQSSRSGFVLLAIARSRLQQSSILLALIAATLPADEVPLSTAALDPSDFHRAGARAVFVARNELHESSVWASDGTPAGTDMIFTPCPSPCDGSSSIDIVGSTGPLAFFVAVDSSLPPGARNLFRTNGTAEGTHALLSPTDAGRLVWAGGPESFAVVGSQLLFRMKAGLAEQIWSTTGSSATTLALLSPPTPPSLATAKICGHDAQTAYIHYSATLLGSWLYRFDALPPGLGTPLPIEGVFTYCQGIVSDGILFVPGASALWTTDGNSPLLPVIDGVSTVSPIEASDGTLLAVARDGVNSIPSLWITDGSQGGTRLLKQGSRWESFYYDVEPGQYERIADDVFYFLRNDGDQLELRRVSTDGTGDDLVSLLCSTGCGSTSPSVWIERLGDDLVASAESPAPGLIRVPFGSVTTEPVQIPCAGGCYPSGFAAHLDGSIVFTISDENGSEMWSLSLGEGAALRQTDFEHVSGAALIELGNLLTVDGRLYLAGQELGFETTLPFAVSFLSPCEGVEPSTLCLADHRFRVRVEWKDFQGGSGTGFADVLTSNTGYLWFFDDANIELMLKIVDGSAYNGHFWVYYGALSNVEYWITVEDTVTGHSKTYHNALGEFGSFGDIEALPASGSPLAKDESPLSRSATADASDLLRPLSTTSETCAPSSTRVCLLDGRFAVEGEWTDFDDNHGVAFAEAMTSDTGYLWFFDPDVAEIVVKLVDGSGFNGKFWVYYGSLSNVEFTIHVTDTVTGETKPYHNPLGAFGSFGDIEAFPAP